MNSYVQNPENEQPYPGHYPGMNVLETEPDQVQSDLFQTLYGPGVDILGIPPLVGYIDPVLGTTVPRWPVFITDALQVQPNAGTGLADESDPWVYAIREYLIPALTRYPINSVWSGDSHLNPAYWNLKALSKRTLDVNQMTPDERQRVMSNPDLRRKLQTGERLTFGELFTVIGQPLEDKEAFNFIPHALHGLVKYVPSVLSYLRLVANDALREQTLQGLPHPIPRAFTDHKSGLSPISLPDEFGLGGNNLYALMRGFYRGWWVEGQEHRGQKVAVLGGTTIEYTLEMLSVQSFDMDFFAIVMLPFSGSMGVDSILSTVEKLSTRYGKKVMFTWDWLPTWQFGPKPASFDTHASMMQAQVLLDELGAKNSPFYDAYQIIIDEWRRITTQRDAILTQIDAAEAAGDIQSADRLRNQLPTPPPMLAERLVRELTETQVSGTPMFQSMSDIVNYLRAGGV